jgi:hypothetical protein
LLSMEGTAAMGLGCTKTRAFNLRVESSSHFGQSENQKCWRRLSEEGNRENGSTLSWLAHVLHGLSREAPSGPGIKRQIFTTSTAPAGIVSR